MKQLVARFTEEHHTAKEWNNLNTILLAGQMGIETDTRRFKIGDGATPWMELGYITSTSATYSAGTGIFISNNVISANLWYEVLNTTNDI